MRWRRRRLAGGKATHLRQRPVIGSEWGEGQAFSVGDIHFRHVGPSIADSNGAGNLRAGNFHRFTVNDGVCKDELPVLARDRESFRGGTTRGEPLTMFDPNRACAVLDRDRAENGALLFPSPAVTLNAVDKGRVCYVGTVPDVSYLRGLLANLCSEAGIAPNVTEPSTPLLESIKVFGTDDTLGEHLHLINFTRKEQSVTLPSPHLLLPEKRELSGCFTLRPFESVLLRKA